MQLSLSLVAQTKAMQKAKINKIGVLTSGGDSPGMNACLRAVVRTAIYKNLKVSGIRRGYQGMIEGDIEDMDSRSVGNILQRGGTILRSARSKEFRTKEGRQKAFDNLRKHGIDALVVIGGDGSFTGAKIFSEEFGIPIVGTPGTIDNDLYGTDNTIGYDTAINTAMEAIDKIRDTADAHNRLFFVEVMGRDAGFIALRSGIASGAESILLPEETTNMENLVDTLVDGFNHNKAFSIVIVAEGDDAGGAFKVADAVQAKIPERETRVSILGHIQRGGNPTCRDRVLASRLGHAAVLALLEGKRNVMIGEINNEIAYTPFEQAIKHHQQMKPDLLELARVLAI